MGENMNAIIVILSCVFDIYILHFFVSNYLEKANRLYDNHGLERVIQIGITTLLVICNIFGNGDLNILFVPVLLLLYTIFLFEGKIRNKLLYWLTVLCVLYGCEFLFMLIIQPGENEYKNSTYIALLMVLIKFLSYVIILVLNNIIGKNKKVPHSNIFMMYMTIPISSLMIMGIIFYSRACLHISNNSCRLLVFGFLLLFVGNIVSFYSFERHSERLYETMKQNIVIVKQKKDLDYYMQMSQINQRQKEMIHNITNQTKMICLFAKEGKNNEIIDITNSICSEIESDAMTVMCSNPILNSILNEKLAEAKQLGIKFEVYVEPGIQLDHIQAIDLISMFGNLYDNAIRAASESSEDKYINTFIYMNEMGGFCVAKILNTFSKVKSLENGEFITTKEDEGVHGIGLQSVNRIAEKYGGCLTCSVNGKEFESVLLISTDEE